MSNAFVNNLERGSIKNSLTENGALGFSGSRNAIVDFNFKLPSLRRQSEAEVMTAFSLCYTFDQVLAVALAFFVRDIRGGAGERRTFRTILKWLCQSHPEVATKVLSLVPEYGRWDDLLSCLEVEPVGTQKAILSILKDQFFADLESDSPSLLAKWLPSVNTSSKETCRLGGLLAREFGLTKANYRKALAKVRAKLGDAVVETKLSSKRTSEVDYEAVPSKANLRYKNSFLRNDTERRKEFLEKLAKGEAKVNSGAIFPYEIIHNYCTQINEDVYDQLLEGMWKGLPELGISDTLVVVDTSESMTTNISGTTATALEVAYSLGIYCAERCKGPFENCVISFSETPQFIRLPKGNLKDKLNHLDQYSEIANTNIERTFQLILNTAVKANLPQEDLPKQVLIISDMEFDSAVDGDVEDSLFETIAKSFVENGYEMPKLAFWNVNGRTDTFPITADQRGVLLSGFSASLAKMVMSNKLDPWGVLKETLESDRYRPIINALQEP